MNTKVNLSLLLIALAVFVFGIAGEDYAQEHSLTVINTGAGEGTVRSIFSGIKCSSGSTCSKTFSDGKKVTLTAWPGIDSSFAGWAGGGCMGIGSCSIIMDSDATVTATFDLKTPEISLSTDSLTFDFSTGANIVMKKLVISNIGTGNLTVNVSGLDGTGFKILGRSNFTVKPGKKHTLRVYILTASLASALKATEGMGADERVSGSGASDGENRFNNHREMTHM